MNFLIVILIIIILLLILYLCYKNYQYNKSLENFDNTTQSSLSTYFQNTIDADSYATDKNMYHKTRPSIKINNKMWDGIWVNTPLNIYAQFVQNNDTLIISLSNSSFNQISGQVSSSDLDGQTNATTGITCYENSFVGLGKLSDNYSKFILTQVICNQYSNSSLNLTAYNLTGAIDDSTKIIQLYSKNNGQVTTIPLTLQNTYTYYNNYVEKVSENINTYPIIPNSNFQYNQKICNDPTTPCYDSTNGIATTTYNGITYNACGTTTSSSGSTCVGTPSCIFNSVAVNGIPPCPAITPSVYDYMNIAPLTVQTQYNGNSLLLCDYLNYFSDQACNSCILCYITNIGNAYTLNYQFFGALSDESSLTVQSDMMDQILNNSSSTFGLLPYYRNAIQNNTNQTDVLNGISFTNCDGDSNTCLNLCKNYINNYSAPIGNQSLYPCVWEINANSTTNVLNSCSITLSTSKNYNTPVKYAEFNNDGTTNLSLYSGGLKQELFLEKINNPGY